jgi:hypothetical protein
MSLTNRSGLGKHFVKSFEYTSCPVKVDNPFANHTMPDASEAPEQPHLKRANARPHPPLPRVRIDRDAAPRQQRRKQFGNLSLLVPTTTAHPFRHRFGTSEGRGAWSSRGADNPS